MKQIKTNENTLLLKSFIFGISSTILYFFSSYLNKFVIYFLLFLLNCNFYDVYFFIIKKIDNLNQEIVHQRNSANVGINNLFFYILSNFPFISVIAASSPLMFLGGILCIFKIKEIFYIRLYKINFYFFYYLIFLILINYIILYNNGYIK